ncbi:MAG: helix-turn-helix domain-containing protein [Dehalococcoidia bacterium]|nr:helix-turn-helix domain-containing protein [Dehalococcoidia bacterium]
MAEIKTEVLGQIAVADIARFLGLSREVVWRKLAAKELPGHRPGKKWLVFRDEWVAWLRTHGMTEAQFDMTARVADVKSQEQEQEQEEVQGNAGERGQAGHGDSEPG